MITTPNEETRWTFFGPENNEMKEKFSEKKRKHNKVEDNSVSKKKKKTHHKASASKPLNRIGLVNRRDWRELDHKKRRDLDEQEGRGRWAKVGGTKKRTDPHRRAHTAHIHNQVKQTIPQIKDKQQQW